MKIRLTETELLQAGQVGLLRKITNLRIGRQASYGLDNAERGLELDFQGACGEIAVAKALGMYWNGRLGKLHLPDVGSLEVRTTTGTGNRLILHPKDHDSSTFILVTGYPPDLTLRGWILGSAGKEERFWTDPGTGRPAFFVPQQELWPMSDLKR